MMGMRILSLLSRTSLLHHVPVMGMRIGRFTDSGELHARGGIRLTLPGGETIACAHLSDARHYQRKRYNAGKK
jgi:hypothetical protein